MAITASEITCSPSSPGSHARQKPCGMKFCCEKSPARNEVMASSLFGLGRRTPLAGELGHRRQYRNSDRFCDVAHPKPIEHVGAVHLYGSDADAELIGDHLV